MKIYKLSQNINTGYDTYSDCIVIAENEEEAKRTHPSIYDFKKLFYNEEKKQFWNFYSGSDETYLFEDEYGTWTNDLDKIKVEYIGEAKEGSEKDLVCASFHAG